MKTEASARRALEKCMFERCLALFFFSLGDSETDGEILEERDRQVRGDLLFIIPEAGEASGQPYYGPQQDKSDESAVGHGAEVG